MPGLPPTSLPPTTRSPFGSDFTTNAIAARAGVIAGTMGIDDPYEAPLTCELTVATDGPSESESANVVVDYIAREAR